ncbi:hypothetical protein RHGRI_023344 [Rhododendron griersonianum]|uniref:Uncharacterized protein n=1 Tax=Rhododendron griersonianum TaxID=479676 RepID=A0AAV6J396_9ERIC|nr:hypothetical protein RHGRI_023344 [Rhododendron griersonianum]
MATNSPDAKWAHPRPTEIEQDEIEEEGEEEEALSLCDLPINNQQNHQPTKEEEEAAAAARPIKPEEDFDFKSLIGSVLTQPQMCAADDVFFRGQIIPLRHSVSSEGADFSRTPSRCISRSESMDRFHSITALNSVTNSRSSSVRSLRSSSSGSSTTTTTTNHKHKVLNQFHSHPSPSPQIRIPSSRYSGNRVPKSHIWSFFRVGLVHTPEIELQGLKNRSGSRNGNNSGFGSRNSNSSSNSSNSCSEEKKKKKNKQRFFGNNGDGFFGGGGCKCSADAVETTMPLRVVIVEEEEDQKEKGKTKKEKKQTVSRHRTFEWLKELSNAGAPD